MVRPPDAGSSATCDTIMALTGSMIRSASSVMAGTWYTPAPHAGLTADRNRTSALVLTRCGAKSCEFLQPNFLDISAKEPIMAAKPIPDGYHTVTPYLTVRGAAK